MVDPAQSGERILLRDGAVMWREVDGEVVALDLAASEYLAINRTGTTLWTLMETGASRSELVSALMDAFDLPFEQAEADVDSFVSGLEERGLVKRRSA